MADLGTPLLGRCTALLLGAGAALTGTTHLVHRTPSGPDFAAALTWLAGWVLVCCCGWAVVAALGLVVAAMRGPDLLKVCCPRRWRPIVLAAAGAAVAVGAVAPAQADPWRPPGLARPVDSPVPRSAARSVDGAPAPRLAQAGPAARGVVVVDPGDSLWRIVAARHPDADDATVAALVAAAYRSNQAVIGDDPDLLRPGQQLRLPEERSPR